MAGVTIAGTALECSEGGENAPVLIGEAARAYAGNASDTVRGQKRTFSFTTAPTLEATWDTVRAAIANLAHITVSGLILSGDSITARVSATARPNPGDPSYWIISGSGEEV